MTKKDFEAIAATFALTRPYYDGSSTCSREYDLWFAMMAEISCVLAKSNKLFNYDRFKAACMK